MTRAQAKGMAAWAAAKGFDAVARPALYAEAWVVTVNGRAYGTIYHVEKAVAGLEGAK